MNKIKTEIEWHINIQSQTNVPASVTKDDFLKALFSINRENNQKRINEFDQKMRDDFPDEVSIWQTDKKKELQSKFINSLNIEFTDDQVTIVCDFNCNFPGDWNKVDVIEWSEGFDKLYVEYQFFRTSDFNIPIFDSKIPNKSVMSTAFNSGKNAVESAILLMMYIIRSY